MSVLAASLLFVQMMALQPAPDSASFEPAKWSISQDNALVWDGKPYSPVGLRIDGSEQAISLAKESGVEDVIVELGLDGSDWQQSIDLLDKSDLRYMIAITSMAPATTGVAVEPESYRVSDISDKMHVEYPIPGATRGYMVFAQQRDASVTQSRPISIKDGWVNEDLDPLGLPHVMIVYPLKSELRFPDFWSGLDAHRDRLLGKLRGTRFGAGFRGLINPLGNLIKFPAEDAQFVPTSPDFQRELEALLRSKYTSVESVARAWGIQAPDFTSLTEISRLVPLWSSVRGVPMLWDTVTNRTYACSNKRSAAWSDIQSVIHQASSRRFTRLIEAIKQVVNVPVIQEWKGWHGPYASASYAADGLGYRMVGPSVTLSDDAARVCSTSLNWNDSHWLLASDINVNSADDPSALLQSALNDSLSLGARAWFVRATTDSMRKLVASAAPRMAQEATGLIKPRGLCYPESAMNPAAPMKLPGGAWWLPSPGAGNRIDMGSQYSAYRYSDGRQSFTAIWSLSGPVRVKLLLTSPKKALVSCVDGSDPKPKVIKNGIEVNIGSAPLIVSGVDEIPVPENALDEALTLFGRISKQAEKRLYDMPRENAAFREAFAGVKHNPGASFLHIRAQIQRLVLALSEAIWIEAETCKTHNFSEVRTEQGASNNAVISLSTSVPSLTGGYKCSYSFLPRIGGSHTVWLAARIPHDQLKNVSVTIGDQVMRPSGYPISLYSSGYGWYQLGEFSTIPNKMDLLLKVDGPGDLDIDAIVLAPMRFRPNGALPPLDQLLGD